MVEVDRQPRCERRSPAFSLGGVEGADSRRCRERARIPKERVSKSQDFWLDDLAALDTPENRVAWLKGSTEDWATESLLAAREAYQDPATGQKLKLGTKLADVYHEKSLPRGPSSTQRGWSEAGDRAQ